MRVEENVKKCLQKMALAICGKYWYLITCLFCTICRHSLKLELVKAALCSINFASEFCAMQMFLFLQWAEKGGGVAGDYHLAFHCTVVAGMAKPTQKVQRD